MARALKTAKQDHDTLSLPDPTHEPGPEPDPEPELSEAVSRWPAEDEPEPEAVPERVMGMPVLTEDPDGYDPPLPGVDEPLSPPHPEVGVVHDATGPIYRRKLSDPEIAVLAVQLADALDAVDAEDARWKTLREEHRDRVKERRTLIKALTEEIRSGVREEGAQMTLPLTLVPPEGVISAGADAEGTPVGEAF